MSLFPHTVTILNKYEQDGKVLYSKATIVGVQFILDEVSQIRNTGSSKDCKVTCYIPNTAKCDKVFVDSFTFKNSEDIDRNTSYTISNGDFIGYGDISLDDLSINEYKNNVGNLYEISGISDFQFGSKLDNKVIVAK